LTVTSACEQSINYESYIDLSQKGEIIFYEDVSFCKNYANLNAIKNEGSQGAGERFIREQNLFSLCMEEKRWVMKP